MAKYDIDYDKLDDSTRQRLLGVVDESLAVLSGSDDDAEECPICHRSEGVQLTGPQVDAVKLRLALEVQRAQLQESGGNKIADKAKRLDKENRRLRRQLEEAETRVAELEDAMAAQRAEARAAS